MRIRTLAPAIGAVVAVSALGVLATGRTALDAQESAKVAPIFEVDPFWPRPLPNHWVTGSTIGLSVDAQDQILRLQVQHRLPVGVQRPEIHEQFALLLRGGRREKD